MAGKIEWKQIIDDLIELCLKHGIPSSRPFVVSITASTVDVIKEVEVTKWRNIYRREFESVKHFKEWYQEQGFLPLLPSGSYKVDCDDYAQRLQVTALEQGYPVSTALIKNGMYYGQKVSGIAGAHAGNLVLIAGVYYYVEPEIGEIKLVKVTNRD